MNASESASGNLLSNLLAGLTSGLVNLVYSLSFAALIFSGRLTPYFPQGVGIALVGATVTAVLVAWRSPFPFTVAGPEANSAILIALAAGSIATALDAAGREASVFPTIWAAILLSTVATGLFLYLLGRYRWGRLARYIPYPVIGGFLAGTGWLITRSSFKVMTGVPLGWADLPTLLSGAAASHWMAGVLMAAVLFLVIPRSRHFLTLPGLLGGGILVGNLVASVLSRVSPGGDLQGWFFEPFARDAIWLAWNARTPDLVDVPVLVHQGGTLLAMMVIVMLSILLNSTGLELATSRSVDLDQELKADGFANLVSGLCGGMVGYLSINRCLLNQQAGARSRMAGVIAGGVCGTVLFLGSSFLAYVPKPVLGGLLLYIGVSLLVRWVIQARRQFSRTDYFLIVVILVVIATLGFLQGVGAGILISCLLFILSYGRTSSVKHLLSGRHHPSNVYRTGPQQQRLEQEGDTIAILVLQGFVFFGTANDLLEVIRRRLASPGPVPLAYAVFDFRLVTGLDSSAVMSFLKLRQLAAKSGLTLLFTQLQPSIQSQLKQGGLFAEGPACPRQFADLDRGMEWCEDRILAGDPGLDVPVATLDSQLLALLRDPSLAAAMCAYFEGIEVAQGQPLFREGEPSDGLYFLESGRASVVVVLPGGRTLRRRTYGGGAILGEMGFYSLAPRSATVIADQPCRFHRLSLRTFERIESEAPHLASSFSRGVVSLLAERLRRSEEELRGLLQ
jgi:SulP family sulfate permease